MKLDIYLVTSVSCRKNPLNAKLHGVWFILYEVDLFKVRTFWETHKNLRNLRQALDVEDFFQILCVSQNVRTLCALWIYKPKKILKCYLIHIMFHWEQFSTGLLIGFKKPSTYTRLAFWDLSPHPTHTSSKFITQHMWLAIHFQQST